MLKVHKAQVILKIQSKFTTQTIKAVLSLTAFLTKTGNRSQTAGSLAVNVKMLETQWILF